MNYKMIALDMDGTLLDESKNISSRNKKAIQKAKAIGKKVVIATGRPLVGIKWVLNELEINASDDYVIAFNGALVQNVHTEDVIFQRTLSLEDYTYLYQFSQAYGVHIQALTESYVTTPVHNPYTQVEADINQIQTVLCDVHAFDPNETIVKVMFVDEKEKLDDIEKHLPEVLKSNYSVLRSAPIFLEFLNPEVNKGVGVQAIAAVENYDASEIICVGDAGNDIAMIEYAGLGVAMANASPSVKDVANHITDSNEDDGVAKVIETFMLA